MSFLIGIDVGTSSTKAVLINASGKVIYTTSPEYSFSTPKALWAESNPEDWWQATLKALKAITQQVDPSSITGIGLTGQMHGLVLLSESGEVLRPCIMWNDQRTGAQCRELTQRVGAEKVLELTGNPILPGFTAGKILWVQQHEPEVWQQTRHILLPKDYIRYRLSGAFVSDVSDASGTSLLDVGQRKWSETMLQACGIDASQMPEVLESAQIGSTVNDDAAKLTGLRPGTPIVAGGGDQAAGAIGCGIVKPGLVSCTLGTSGVVFAHSESYQPDPAGRLHTFCSAVTGKWHYMGVQLSCAGSYQWWHDHLGNGKSFPELNDAAASVPAGSDGLQFLPYLTGERTPHPDPHAQAAFIGLTLRHGHAHMTRAVLEGVTYGLRDGLDIMRDLGIQPQEIIASGGGTKSALWRQIMADVFATPITTVNATEGGAYGAALLASVGTEVYPDITSACETVLEKTGTTQPGDDQAAYEQYYPLFKKLYPALQTHFAENAQLTQ